MYKVESCEGHAEDFEDAVPIGIRGTVEARNAACLEAHSGLLQVTGELAMQVTHGTELQEIETSFLLATFLVRGAP